MTRTLSCVVVGGGALTIRCAEILMAKGVEIRALFTDESAASDWAAENQVSVSPVKDIRKVCEFKDPFDYLFSIVNFALLPEDVIAVPTKAAINFHDGPLPTYAGLNVTSWAIINGEDRHAVTWHLITEGIDRGAILLNRDMQILPDDTAFSLNTKCFEIGMESFEDLVDGLVGETLIAREQSAEGRSYFAKYKRPRAAGLVSFDQPAERISRMIRGLNFGDYANPLGRAKIYLGGQLFTVAEAEVLSSESTRAPGTVLAVASDRITFSTGTRDITVSHMECLSSPGMTPGEAGVEPDSVLVNADLDLDVLDEENVKAARHEDRWLQLLRNQGTVSVSHRVRSTTTGESATWGTFSHTLRGATELHRQTAGDVSLEDFVVTVTLLYLSRLNESESFCVGVSPAALQQRIKGLDDFFYGGVPFEVEIGLEESVQSTLRRLSADVAACESAGALCRDAVSRYPELRDKLGGMWSPDIVLTTGSAEWASRTGTPTVVIATQDTGEVVWQFDERRLDVSTVRTMAAELQTLVDNCVRDIEEPLSAKRIVSQTQYDDLVVRWNETSLAYPKDKCVHDLFVEQARHTPEALAVVAADRQLTYRELDEESNRLASYLLERDVRGSLVGIHTDRSCDLLVAVLAVMKAGCAYVPLDPEFPTARIEFMLEDADIGLVITQSWLADQLDVDVDVIVLDRERSQIAERSDKLPDGLALASDLCYVIYTSGSTGKPKGVMVTHSNVVNFTFGMDEVVGGDDAGTWLAVTSLSFDISVLEILWTLSRGFKVVLYDSSQVRTGAGAARKIDFSLFYFSSDEEGKEKHKYGLLLEGAKFGDKNGFCAVWTPERHFHKFGGLYPNPSVTGAAVAAVTSQIGIRAGSCVSPLHNSIRIAEEWSVVDNISDGRVGISFAAGWHPNDFSLAPDNYESRKELMFRQIEEVRTLWRGGTLSYPNGKGEETEVSTLPRPIQEDLPVWITAAGNPETFREAGAKGYNVLTHLLGQSLEELSNKIAIYRKARKDNGFDPAEGTVSLMLHTFVGDDNDVVREIVRKPMKDYLASSIGLIKAAAWSFPTFRDKTTATDGSFSVDHMSESEMNDLLDFSFERYFATSGLFGTVDTCLEIVNNVRAIDVDEIACLIDFGVDEESVLQQLPLLAEVLQQSNDQVDGGTATIPYLIETYGVSHMQCTPSMASMLVADPETRTSLRHLQHMFVGGEAFPAPLAEELQGIVGGRIVNMYGPTETTIWSSTHQLGADSGTVPIGRPIANTQLYVLDSYMIPVPIGVVGELYIGGDGVTRGYLNREEMTDQRFVPDPFRSGSARLYRTGDLVRYLPDGNLEFLGRVDQQVKMRGYRIELGEVEAALASHPSVRDAAVAIHGDSWDDRKIVGYVTAAGPEKLMGPALLDFVAGLLPSYMVPAAVVVMDAFPLTPNRKIDRKALPSPRVADMAADSQFVAPRNSIESDLCRVWGTVLNVPRVGIKDSFFDLGGNSLVAVRLMVEIRNAFNCDIPLITLYRAPTVEDMAILVVDRQLAKASDTELASVLAELDRSEGAKTPTPGRDDQKLVNRT